MAIKNKVSISKTFFFKQADDGTIKRVEEADEHDGYIMFRQVKAGDVERRTGALSKRMYQPVAGALAILDETNLDTIARIEIMLTLGATDFLMADGRELEFSDRRIKSEKQFNDWWDEMDPQWAREIHKCCLEVNPDWDASKS